MSKSIYYFTGTGNSLYVAKKTAENIGCDSVISIAAEIKNEKIICNSDIVGIVTPLYCSALPKIVTEFLKKAEFNKNCFIFILVTAGNPFSSAAVSEAHNILKRKGNRVSFGAIFKMPDNAILFFNPVQHSSEEKFNLDSKLKSLSMSIINKVKSKPFEFYPFIFTGYIFRYFVKKLDKYFTVNNSCTGCGLCYNICSLNNIKIENNKPVWQKNCEMCLACINVCPSKSINYTKLTENKNRYINQNIDLKELMK
jgi:ferredoxin/flavodoxin